MFKIYCDKARLIITERDVVTSGQRKAFPVKFEFNDEWEDILGKKIVFGNKPVADEGDIAVSLNSENQCMIPWEVCQIPGREIYVGVLGVGNAEETLPSLWTHLCDVGLGTKDGSEGSEPTKTIYREILDAQRDTERIAQSVRYDADNGAFNGKDYVLTETDKQEIASMASGGLNFKGMLNVSDIQALTGQEKGDMYQVLEGGEIDIDTHIHTMTSASLEGQNYFLALSSVDFVNSVISEGDFIRVTRYVGGENPTGVVRITGAPIVDEEFATGYALVPYEETEGAPTFVGPTQLLKAKTVAPLSFVVWEKTSLNGVEAYGWNLLGTNCNSKETLNSLEAIIDESGVLE